MDERQRRLSRELAFQAFTRDARDVQPWVLDRLATLLDERRVHAGENLYRQGEPSDTLFFMSRGRVDLVRDGAPTWKLDGRWVVGGQEVLLERAHSRTAVAVTDLDLVTVPAHPWLELIEDSFDLSRMIVENTARGLAGLYARLGDESFPAPATAPPLPLPDGPLDLVERLLIISKVALLRAADVQTLTDLAAAAEEIRIPPGADLWRRGVPRDRMFIVADGLVLASRENPSVSGRFGPGDVVASAAAFGEPSLAWRAEALTPTRALAIPMELLLDELEEHFDVLRAALAAMSDERERILDALVRREPDVVFR